MDMRNVQGYQCRQSSFLQSGIVAQQRACMGTVMVHDIWAQRPPSVGFTSGENSSSPEWLSLGL